MRIAFADGSAGSNGSSPSWRLIAPARDLRGERAAILFTDIEDSSGLAGALGPLRYADAILAHFGMAHAAVVDAGGEVRQFTGDGLVALWPHRADGDASGALRAIAMIARATERANAAARAQGRPSRRIRLGLHAGEARSADVGSGAPLLLFGAAISFAHRLQQIGKTRATAHPDYVATTSVAGLAAAGAAPPDAPAGALFDLTLGAAGVVARRLGDDGSARPPSEGRVARA